MNPAKQSDNYGGASYPTQNTQLLVLLCLTGLSITEPLLVVFGVNPGVFYFHNIDTRATLVSYVLALAFIPSFSLFALIRLAELLNRYLGFFVYLLFIGLLAAAWFAQVARWSFGINALTFLVSVVALSTAFFIWAYMRWRSVASLLRLGAVAPLVAIFVFFYSSASGGIAKAFNTDTVVTAIDSSKPSVLFVMLDEFPTLSLFDEADMIDSGRFPNLAKLAAQSTWFRHYSVLAGQTIYSVPAILSGKDPLTGSPDMAHYPNNLFTLLARTHHLTVFETLTKLCGLPQCSEHRPGAAVRAGEPQWRDIFGKTLLLWLQRVSLSEKVAGQFDDFAEKLVVQKDNTASVKQEHRTNIFDPAVQVDSALAKPERLKKFMDTFTPHATALYFLHLEMPHLPWRFYASGEVYSLPYTRVPLSAKNNDGGEWLARLTEHRYLMQAQYTDFLLGSMIEKLKALNMWDDMLVIVTADHGRSFVLNTDGRALQPQNLGSTVYAPLFIKQPGQKYGVINDSNMTAYDLLPTIAHNLSVAVPWNLTGFHVGEAGIAQRKGEKVYFPLRAQHKLLPDLAGKRYFKDSEKYPRYQSRRLGVLRPGETSLSQLNSVLHLDHFMGKDPRQFDASAGGNAVLDELQQLRQPSDEKPPQGVLIGNLEFVPNGDRVLISINDEFVTGSPLVSFKGVPNTFIAMLPANVLAANNVIDVFLVTADGLEKLSLE